MKELATLSGRLRHVDGHRVGDEVTGVMLTIHAPDGPNGLYATPNRTGTLVVNDDPTFAQRHHDETFMFFADQAAIYQPFDIRISNGSSTVKLMVVPTMQPA